MTDRLTAAGWIVRVGAALFLVTVTAVYGSLAARIWLHTRAILGPTTPEDRAAMKALVDVSQEGNPLLWARLMLLYAGFGALLVGLLTRENLGLLAATAAGALIWWMRVRSTTPPIVLVLGTSTITAIRRQRAIKRRLAPLRVVSLLDVDVPWATDLRHEMSLDCFRTTNEDDWWEVVLRLIHRSPVIAVDAAATTTGVDREARYVLGSAHARKCVFLTPADGFAPILDRLLPATGAERRGLRIASYEEAPQAIALMVNLARERRSGPAGASEAP
jgi:hypothetical protein